MGDKNLVKLHGSSVLTDTQIVAKALGIKHNDVMRSLFRLLESRPNLREATGTPNNQAFYIEIVKRTYRGQEFSAALLNREAFMLLVMRFETTVAFDMQERFIEAFKHMENRLAGIEINSRNPLWIQSRTAGKLMRAEETDVIREFVEYAEAQGSTNAKFYYKHLTNASYKALSLVAESSEKLRDSLTALELAELTLMEHRAKIGLQECMGKKMHYKEIYSSVASDLMDYGAKIKTPTALSIGLSA